MNTLPPNLAQPQLQAIMYALTHGGSPQGNQQIMPIMQGLGAQKHFMANASPAQTRNVSNFGALAGRPTNVW